jgi:tetratricopeptide (TPR) repeat protein
MAAYYDLGAHTRPVSTASPEAQTWFDRGLVWCYGFNHEEAIRCFERAAEADPGLAMAHWGIAYAIGPNYNKAWDAFEADELVDAVALAYAEIATASSLVGSATPVERALVDALARRFQTATPAADAALWDAAYADAMRDVYRQFPDDLDVAALFAEALITRTPWLLWNLDSGEPADEADTAEAVEVLEAAIARPGPRHPGLLHLYVHTMEMSPDPERALQVADDLRDLVPDSGHLVHMATHIDVLCGLYRDVVVWNDRAIVADQKYLEREGAANFYTLYRCHNFHFKLYGAMFLGQLEPALAAGDELAASLPEELLREPQMADLMEGFVPTRLHALVRFGQWRRLIDEPLPADPELYCVTTSMLHYAKGVAHAALGEVERAEREQALLADATSRVPDTRYLFNNTALDLLAVAAKMLAGEIAYRRGEFDRAFALLREAVALDDALPYDEPWGWMQPVRHALGALLLEQDRTEEALAVYTADLGLDGTLRRPCRHPENVWSLHGYHACLRRLGRDQEAALVRPRLDLALARATVPIASSCFCSRSAVAAD